jgi:hypothetical protein
MLYLCVDNCFIFFFFLDTVGLQDSILVAKAEKHITHIRKNLIAYARSSTFRTIPGKNDR